MKNRRFPHVRTGLALMALVGSLAPVAAADVVEGAKVGQWKTWNTASPDEIPVPAPPADTRDQTAAELNELRLLQAIRSPILNRVAENWNGLAAAKAWTDIAVRIPGSGPRAARLQAYVHMAMFDAVVASYRARYTHNRRAPAQLAPDLNPTVATVPGEPSYPSEVAAVAGAASAVLAFFNPAEAQSYEAMAQEAAYSRMIAGTNYRSDVEAGLALGRAVAARAIARAQSDGSDATWTETVPTGPGFWTGTNPVEPLAGTWKPWILASGSQIRPGPPPAFGSPEFNAALAEVKRLATTVTPSERAISDFWLTTGAWVPFYNTAYSLLALERASLARAARVTAHMATSTADAVIAVWDSKYHYWLLRPTTADPTIPLLTPVPNYPEYPSGFSSVGGAHSEAIAYFFPQEAARVREMADEIVQMRIYQGIHYRFADEVGAQLGRQTAQLCAERDKTNDN